MGYLKINERNKRHLLKLFNWLAEEVQSAGGDGDGIWYSEYFSIDDIVKHIVEENLPKSWSITQFVDHIFVGVQQEGLIITNDKAIFNSRPDWQQVAIQY